MTTPPRRPLSPSDVFALAATDADVARHLAAWTSGSFASFEDMLVSLVCTLSAKRADYGERVNRFLSTLSR